MTADRWSVRSFSFEQIGSDGVGQNGAPLPEGWEPLGAQWINGTWFIIGRRKWRPDEVAEQAVAIPA